MKPSSLRSPALLIVLCCQAGCSGDTSGPGSTAHGGQSSSGGASASMGGASSSGGAGLGGAGLGGAHAAGGATTSSSGGASSGGASTPGAGGSASGGTTTSAGGKSGQSGGTTASGGKSSGGSTAMNGGSYSGGSSATGGAATSGGTVGAGGSVGGSGGDLPASYPNENTGADCPALPTPPAFSALTAVTNLPDPFLLNSGTRITTRDQWRCRRAEIGSLIQHWGSGPKGAPPTNLTATYSGGKLTVVVTQSGASITLTSTISTPSGTGPFPLVIGMNTPTGSLPSSIFTSRGVATMTFTTSQLVSDAFNVTRGAGTYFTMYPDKNTGAMIEWAWGVSRLIDGLYKTVDQNKIDLKRIAVTGCSFQGKIALYAGAFDERIALTIPQESGGGGEASWRFMATQTGTEDLEAAQGTAWYAQNLKQFKNADAPKLPYDQHELVAMVAPRAILTVANTAIDRLGSQAGYVSMKAAIELYKGLGVADRIGYTQAAASAHCTFPTSQTADVEAFVDKFLVGKTSANTAVAKSPYSTDLSKWVTFTTPALK